MPAPHQVLHQLVYRELVVFVRLAQLIELVHAILAHVDVVLLLAELLHEVAELLHLYLPVVVEIKLLEGKPELLGACLSHGLVLDQVLDELLLSESPPIVLVECCLQTC